VLYKITLGVRCDVDLAQQAVALGNFAFSSTLPERAKWDIARGGFSLLVSLTVASSQDGGGGRWTCPRSVGQAMGEGNVVLATSEVAVEAAKSRHTLDALKVRSQLEQLKLSLATLPIAGNRYAFGGGHHGMIG
jgi:hypothetical protein